MRSEGSELHNKLTPYSSLHSSQLNHDVNGATASICTGFEYSDATGDGAKPASGYAYFAYDAAYAFARAAHHALYDATTPFTGSDFKTLEGKTAIMDALKEITFAGVTGSISFEDDSGEYTGDRLGSGNTVTNYDGIGFVTIGEWTQATAFVWEAPYTGPSDMKWPTADNSKPKNKILPKCEISHVLSSVADCGTDGKRVATFSWALNADGTNICDASLADSLALPTDKEVYCSYSPAGSLGGYLALLLGIVGAIVCVGWAVYVFLNMNNKVMKVAQPAFCIIFTLSAAVLSISNVLFVGENTDGMCVLRPFIFNIFFDFMFGSLFMKTFRIYKIFGNKSLSKVRISTTDVIKNYGSIIAVDIAILIVWMITEGMKAETITKTDLDPYPSYTAVICNEAETYSTLTTFFKILMVIGGVYLSYLTRNVPDKFAESKWIAASIYQVFVLGSVGLLVKFTDETGQTLILVQGICVPVACMVTTSCIFAPKVLMIKNPAAYEDALKTSVGTSGNTSTSSGGGTEELEARVAELEEEIEQLKAGQQ